MNIRLALSAAPWRRAAAATLIATGLSAAVPAWAGWLAFHGGPGQDRGTGLVVSGDGSAFLVGRVEDALNGFDIVVRRYDVAGVLVWSHVFDGVVHGNDEPIAAVDDGAGGIVVAGRTQISKDGTDCLVLRVDAAGNRMWARTHHAWDGGRNFGSALIRTASGDFVAGGASRDTTSGADALLVCYSPTGELRWARSDDGGANGSDEVMGLAALSTGDVVCTATADGVGGAGDYWTRRISGATGAVQWEDRYDGPVSGEDWALAVAVGAGDQSFVTGFSVAEGPVTNCVTLGLSSGGTRLWTHRLLIPGWGFSQGTRIRVGPDGSIAVGGTVDFGGDLEALAVKYSAGGSLIWARSLSAFSATGSEEAIDLDMDDLGRLYVAAASESADARYDVTTFVLDEAGNLRWRWLFAGDGAGPDLPTGIHVTGPGQVIIAGSVTHSATGMDMFILSADSTSNVVAVDERAPGTPPGIRFELENPVLGTLRLRVFANESASLEVSVIDLLGRRVAGGGPADRFRSGEHRLEVNVGQLAAGVYLLRVQGHVDGRRQDLSRKFVLLR